MAKTIEQQIASVLDLDFHVTVAQATVNQLYHAISKAALHKVADKWALSRETAAKRVGYFSAEFLIGRMIYNNLLNIGWLESVEELLQKNGRELSMFEEIEDPALGNGGLGRLAACLLDSGATQKIPLDGYGIRYRYGLFRQTIEDGFQKEAPDDWLRFGDPWSVRREEDRVRVVFGDQTVWAVPYDQPVVGYGMKTVNNLRLWQAEPLEAFDFALFNDQKFDEAVREKNGAENLCRVLYPNNDTDKGKRLRLKQQYFFVSASLQDMLRRYKALRREPVTMFDKAFAVQLNDTHPVLAIPELIRLLLNEGLSFEAAVAVTRDTFAYTNHTVMPEALESWNIRLFRSVLPDIYPIVQKLNKTLLRELKDKGVSPEEAATFAIIDGDNIQMARLALFASHAVNGVSQIHTQLLKTNVLPQWYALYPDKFHNVTNGITQRRWLKLANPGLSGLITETIGDKWITDLSQLRLLETYADDSAFLDRLLAIRRVNKERLSDTIERREGLRLPPDWLYDVQIKRLHEYKRQLMNAMQILDTYYRLKNGELPDFYPTVYLFGAKAAPGYRRAKAIIKYISEVARLVNGDPQTANRMQVVFVQNYDVSYAERLIPAADVSEQISTAGTEASGTGNMKFMLNGAVTLGTLDGANIEIVERAGEANNYIFGLTAQQVEDSQAHYTPRFLYEQTASLRRVVDSLTDGTLSDGGSGDFLDLYRSLLDGTDGHPPDPYRLLADFVSYSEARLQLNRDYAQSKRDILRKGLLNTAAAGFFSSDRTVRDYAKTIWTVS